MLICLLSVVTGFPPKPVTTIAPRSAIYEDLRNVAIRPPTRSYKMSKLETYIENNIFFCLILFVHTL